MKIKSGYVLKNFADKYIAVAADDNADNAKVLVTLNSSGAYAWQLLQNDITYDEAVKSLLDKYNAPEEVIRDDFDGFLRILRDSALLDE